MNGNVLSTKYFLSESDANFDSVSMEVHKEEETDSFMALSGNFRLNMGGGLSQHEFMIAGYPDDDAVEMVEAITRTLGEIAAAKDALDTYAASAETELRATLYRLLGVSVVKTPEDTSLPTGDLTLLRREEDAA